MGEIPYVAAYLDDLEACLKHGGAFIDGARWCAARAAHFLSTFPQLRDEHLSRWRDLVERMEELAPDSQPNAFRERFRPLFAVG